ncbi:MAG: hypothetical protein ACYTFE_03235, partial [Planctomycetota bacterium]
KFQRAYMLECEEGPSKVEMELAGSKETPIVNPAFVFKGWGDKDVIVKVGDEALKQGENYRAGYEKKIDGVDLVLWFEGQSDETMTFTVNRND